MDQDGSVTHHAWNQLLRSEDIGHFSGQSVTAALASQYKIHNNTPLGLDLTWLWVIPTKTSLVIKSRLDQEAIRFRVRGPGGRLPWWNRLSTGGHF